MDQDKASAASPFSALTYQEQQDRWLAWRSRQLDYQPAGSEPPTQQPRMPLERPDPRRSDPDGLPRMCLPNMLIDSPTRHQELDQVISRHRQALKKAAVFQTTPIG